MGPRTSKSGRPAATASEISRLTGVSCEPFPIGGPCPSGLIALTYDDGPLPQRTNAILDALDRAGIRATFFTVGYLVEDYPEVVQKAAEAGHVIASHTYLHEILPSMSDAEIAQTLRKADSAIRAAGVTPAIREACPKDTGLTLVSFSLTSVESPCTAW